MYAVTVRAHLQENPGPHATGDETAVLERLLIASYNTTRHETAWVVRK
jgi:hypothetical protein